MVTIRKQNPPQEAANEITYILAIIRPRLMIFGSIKFENSTHANLVFLLYKISDGLRSIKE